MIKKNYLIVLIFLLLSFKQHAQAQCTGGTLAGNLTITSAFQTISYVNGGTYYTFNAVAGQLYHFTFCAANGGSSSFDTQISILNNFGLNESNGFSEDYCGVQAYVIWTCPATGVFRVLLTEYSCQSRNNMGTLAYKLSTPATCPGGLGSGVTTVASLPYSTGAGSTSGQINDLNSNTIDVGGAGNYYAGEDRVWSFTPAVAGTVTVNLNTGANKVSLALFKGCPLKGNNSSCLSYSQGNGNRTLTACLEAGTTYYVEIDSKSPTNNFSYSNLTISAPSNVSSCSLGTTIAVASLPYSNSGRTTCGKGDEVTGNNTISCGNTSYLSGEDEVFVFTPTTSGNISATIVSGSTYTGLFLYEGCPIASYCAGTGNKCIGYANDASGNKSICGYVIAGRTYYLVVDSWGGCVPYSISITAPTSNFTGATCANPVVISALPFSAVNENTACFGNDYSNYTTGSCGSAYESGEDKVYKYVALASECLGITLKGTSTNAIGFQVYNGVPGAGGTCIGYAGGAYGGTLSGSITLPAAGTYYLIIDTWADPMSAQYSLEVNSYGTTVINDSPCDAIPLAFSVNVSGDNNCSAAASEPAAPACWTLPNTLNTVWYSFTAAATTATIRTTQGTLRNTQIAVYKGTCGNTMTLVGCNDNAPSCGNIFYTTPVYTSQLNLTGLISGTQYFIAVDGFGSTTGSFSIMVINGSTVLPPATGQECPVPLPVCNGVIAVGDPGFQSFGNQCDFPGFGTNCIATGERGSAWYEILIQSAGVLQFTITPNDWPGAPSLESTDYDFAMWKTAGTGAVTCANISSGSTPIKCNYSNLGVTGLFSNANGTAPAAYPGFGPGFQSQLTVAAGEKYMLMISNFSNSVSGFTVSFDAASPINFTPSSSTVVWTGGVDNDWFKMANWGGCQIPNCTISAQISPASSNQPVINAAGATCKSLSIAPGSSLTIGTNQKLSVCQDLTNNGDLIAKTGSTIELTGTGNQTISGYLLNNSAIANFTVNKASGIAILQNDLQVNEDFTIMNASGAFNGSGKTITLAGDFSNVAGTFNAATNGLLIFNGTVDQSYLNIDSVNSVQLKKLNGNVVLESDMILESAGILTLNSGKIVTTSYEVNCTNTSTSAVTSGNATSYVEGYLRRYLPLVQAPIAYDFPVGHSTTGYERMNMAFYNGADPAINSLRVHFSPYVSGPPGPMGQDPSCGISFTNIGLNNGFWSVLPQANGTTSFHMTLYNTGYTNAGNAYTVDRKLENGVWSIPSIQSGGCIAPPVTAVLRNGIQQSFVINEAVLFGTAQGSSALPVTLLSLIAEPKTSSIIVSWITASELNNKGFEILRATNPDKFTSIGFVDGHGSTSQLNNYHFEDKEIQPNIRYYYRLKQIDIDGKASLSAIVAASIKEQGMAVFEVFPNPYKDNTAIHYILSRPSIVTIEITDIQGKMIKKYQQGLQDAGRYSVNFSAKNNGLPSGVYNVTLWCDDQRYQTRITETN